MESGGAPSPLWPTPRGEVHSLFSTVGIIAFQELPLHKLMCQRCLLCQKQWYLYPNQLHTFIFLSFWAAAQD